jgi:predicted RNA-binding Zn-ribbon protein involved in translation (DUF1610 family)
VALIAAQGELPKLPPLGQPFAMVELRSDDGEVLSIDYGTTPTTVGRGREVRLDDLQLTGLAAESAREEKARQFACPNCGAQVEVQLEGTRSITCRSCHSLIDLSQGIGGELRHAIQDEPVQPLIPLGTVGTLQAAQWQVVGFQHRMGWLAGEDDERFGWSEYLLFNLKRGFVFLVDSQEGWSLVRPVTGAPSLSRAGNEATYLGTRYALKESYTAETDYVAGEFYWPVERGQRTANSDFTAGKRLLSMERSPREVTWSSGGAIASDAVVQAFKLQGKGDQMRRGDAGPTSSGGGMGCGCATILVIFIVIIFLVILFEILRDDRGSAGSGGVRSSGGSWGGSSSGGGHK